MKKIIPLKQQEILTISGGTNVTNHTRTPEEEKNDNLCWVAGTIQLIAITLHTINTIRRRSLRLHQYQYTPQQTTYYRPTTPEIKIEQPLPVIKIEEDWYK